MKRIESRNNPTIKFANSLRNRRDRTEQGLFYFEGVHLLEEFLKYGGNPYCVFIREDVVGKYETLINQLQCEVYEVTSSVYDKLTDEKAPQGIFTVCNFLKNVVELNEKSANALNGNSVMLADLQDMGNVGTVIRTATALGCNVILGGNCADIYSAKTVRATMGALFSGNIYVCKSAETAVLLLKSSGVKVIATALTDKAEVLGRFDIGANDCFVVGNEGQGLSESVISLCDVTAIIPMSGKTESLNAATAAAMLLWEAKRGQMNEK